MRRWLSAWMIAAPLLAQESPLATLKALFDYDVSKPLNTQVTPVRQEPGAKISEFAYDSANSGRVDGYLVTPSAEGKKYAGLVFGHWGWAIEQSSFPRLFYTPVRERSAF